MAPLCTAGKERMRRLMEVVRHGRVILYTLADVSESCSAKYSSSRIWSFEKTPARKYAFDILDHLGVTTSIGDRVGVIKAEPVGILAQHILDATHLALPIRLFPWPTDRWYVLQPSVP